MAVALAVLAFGLPAAVFVLWPLVGRRRAPLPVPADDPRADLEAEKLLALRAIRELEWDHQAGLLSEADCAGLRARYEARAGAILKRLDALPPPVARPPADPDPAATPAAPTPWTRRSLVLTGGALGILLFGVVLGLLVGRYSGPAPPDPMAAPQAAEMPVPGGPPAPETASPRPIPKAMLEGMLRAAHESLDAGRYQEAIAAYKAVLKREPTNVEAITHLGVILAIAGHADGALEAFDRALAIDPAYAHALWDKARVLYELRQDYARAIAAWERFVAVAPPGQDREQALSRIREAKARLAATPSSAGRSPPGSTSAGSTPSP